MTRARPVPRSVLTELCETLGHDYQKVSTITLTPTEVLVTYAHPVTDGLEED